MNDQPRFKSVRHQLKAERMKDLIDQQARAALELEKTLSFDEFVNSFDPIVEQYGADHRDAVIDRMREIDPETEA